MLVSFDGCLTIYLRDTFGYSSQGAGLTYISIVIPEFFSPLVGRLADKYGPQWIATGGFALGTVPLACLRFVDHDSIRQRVLLCALFFLVGMTAVNRLPIYSAEVSRAARDLQARWPGLLGDAGGVAQATSLWSAAYTLGCAIGPIWGGLIKQVAGWKTETWTVALLSGIAIVPAYLFTGQARLPSK